MLGRKISTGTHRTIARMTSDATPIRPRTDRPATAFPSDQPVSISINRSSPKPAAKTSAAVRFGGSARRIAHCTPKQMRPTSVISTTAAVARVASTEGGRSGVMRGEGSDIGYVRHSLSDPGSPSIRCCDAGVRNRRVARLANGRREQAIQLRMLLLQTVKRGVGDQRSAGLVYRGI